VLIKLTSKETKCEMDAVTPWATGADSRLHGQARTFGKGCTRSATVDDFPQTDCARLQRCSVPKVGGTFAARLFRSAYFL